MRGAGEETFHCMGKCARGALNGGPQLLSDLVYFLVVYMPCSSLIPGADAGGGGGLGGQVPHPTLFGGPPNFIQREENVPRMCVNMPRLSCNSYPDTPFRKSCILPWIHWFSAQVLPGPLGQPLCRGLPNVQFRWCFCWDLNPVILGISHVLLIHYHHLRV